MVFVWAWRPQHFPSLQAPSQSLVCLACILRVGHLLADNVENMPAEPCRLAFLQLRSSNQALDLEPAFTLDVFSYTAMLDFQMETFAVDVQAQPGCEADGAPNEAVSVKYGDTSQVTLFARNPHNSMQQKYEVQVSRQLGIETNMRSLRIEDAELIPAFSPDVRSYTAYMALGHDFIRVAYVLADAGQQVLCKAAADSTVLPAMLFTTRTTTAVVTSGNASNGSNSSKSSNSTSGDDNTASGRRLAVLPASSDPPASGELQRLERWRTFPIDVGDSRRVSFLIESADPSKAYQAFYTVDVLRHGCNSARPLYSPTTRTCTTSCPVGHYPSYERQRCSMCNTHCAVCSSLRQCELCLRDTVRYRYTLQPDGSCAEENVALEDKYQWWCIGFAIFIGCLLCLPFCLLCDYLCALLCGFSCFCATGGEAADSGSEDVDVKRRRGRGIR